MPFDPKDAMFSPPARKLPKPMPPPSQEPPKPQPQAQNYSSTPTPYQMPPPNAPYPPSKDVPSTKERPSKSRSKTKGVISPEEDIRRLFEECEMAKANASMLSQSLTFARPEDVLAGGQGALIRVGYMHCLWTHTKLMYVPKILGILRQVSTIGGVDRRSDPMGDGPSG